MADGNTCTKLTFGSKRQALRFHDRYYSRSGLRHRHGRTVRAYRCERCGGWHVTKNRGER